MRIWGVGGRLTPRSATFLKADMVGSGEVVVVGFRIEVVGWKDLSGGKFQWVIRAG